MKGQVYASQCLTHFLPLCHKHVQKACFLQGQPGTSALPRVCSPNWIQGSAPGPKESNLAPFSSRVKTQPPSLQKQGSLPPLTSTSLALHSSESEALCPSARGTSLIQALVTVEGQGDDASSLSLISSHYLTTERGGSNAFLWLARIPGFQPPSLLSVNTAKKKCYRPRVTKESEKGRQPILPGKEQQTVM